MPQRSDFSDHKGCLDDAKGELSTTPSIFYKNHYEKIHYRSPQELRILSKLSTSGIEFPGYWRNGDTLRHIHACRFDLEQTIQVSQNSDKPL